MALHPQIVVAGTHWVCCSLSSTKKQAREKSWSQWLTGLHNQVQVLTMSSIDNSSTISEMATEEEENGWRAAVTACSDENWFPLGDFNPDDASDVEFICQALQINEITAQRRLR